MEITGPPGPSIIQGMTNISDIGDKWPGGKPIGVPGIKVPVWVYFEDIVTTTNLSLSALQNGTTDPRDLNDTANYLSFNPLTGYITNSFILIISLFGLLGTGAVIWLLGFHMKRSPFTTYILNLAVADFGVLISLVSVAILGVSVDFDNGYDVLSLSFVSFFELFFFTFSTGQFLLVAISVDRCVAVLFPLWHRCHRPPYLSTLVCSLIWVLSLVLSGIHFTQVLTQSLGASCFLYQLIVNALLCTLLMVLSTLTLFIKVCRKQEQHRRGKLVTAILLALLFFLLFAFPLNAFYAITYFSSAPHHDLMASGLICACLNSSVNPLIYFLVGRGQKKGQPRWSMKAALQRVFKDEEDGKEWNKPTKSPLLNEGAEDYGMDNGTADYNELQCSVVYREITDIAMILYFIFINIVCVLGLVGNGIVIWLLGFRLKRNPFTTYVLNLAVADFGVLVFHQSIAFDNHQP
ncbi:hypothetical protein lerEdw1_014382 [Lerista edwardsae]|nr:hypothetical protein lerEdw1_014382 [Lerista edwardsae]